MDEKKDLSKVDLKAQAIEVRSGIVSCVAQLDAAQDSISQAEADKREARAEYNSALDTGDKMGMDSALAKIAAAAEVLKMPAAGIEGIRSRINEFQARQQELIGEARRRKAALKTKIAELTKQLPGAEGVIGDMSVLAMEIGKLDEKLRDLSRNKKT
jgi:chromosome segregation ATPase